MTETGMKALLQQYETPFYVLEEDKLKERVAFLKSHLPKNVALCYAVKANTFLIPALMTDVERMEICSPGELAICRKVGVPMEQCVISGVYKQSGVMESFVREGVEKDTAPALYTVESKAQFALLQQAAEKYHTVLPVLLRLTSGNQFGLDETDIEQIIAERNDQTALMIRGIQYFSGTQKTSLKRLKRELDRLDDFLDHLKETYGYAAEELEFGPGLPVPYFAGDIFEEEPFLQGFSELLENLRFSGKITLELGRSMAASCGQYVTQVVDIKQNHGESYAIVDGGMHQLVYFGQSLAMKQPGIRLYSGQKTDGDHKWNICGSLCTANDILVKQMPLPNLHIGDVLAFQKTGAYCLTEGIALFLSRDIPKVLWVSSSGQTTILRHTIQTEVMNTPMLQKEKGE